MFRDGYHQTAVHKGVAPYRPNSLDDGLPLDADAKNGGYVHTPREVAGPKVRESPVSFGDHFSQATLFWASMSDVEKSHIVEAFTFELGKCMYDEIRERYLDVLANVDTNLTKRVAAGLGLPAPKAATPPKRAKPSPALSMVVDTPGPIAGRVIGVVATPDSDLAGIGRLRRKLNAEGAVLRVIAPVGGTLGEGRGSQVVERTLLTTRSIEFDAVVIAGGTAGLADHRLAVMLQELYRHCKAIGAWGDGVEILQVVGIDPASPGVVTAKRAGDDLAAMLVEAVGKHRAWDRAPLVMTKPA
jgi:catalase